MRMHLTYIAILIALVLISSALFSRLQAVKLEREKLKSTITTLSGKVTQTAAVIQVQRDEIDSLIKDYEARIKAKATQVHYVNVYHNSVSYDTVPVYDCLDTLPVYLSFMHPCYTSIVEYYPATGLAKDSLIGNISITRYELIHKPRWLIVKPRYWRRSNWPKSVRVENSCGMELIENTIIEIE